MHRILKQVCGIDVAQHELVATLARLHDDLTPDLYASHCFANNAKGFAGLIQWVNTHTETGINTRYVMEATGVYHEGLAYFLASQQARLSVVLPTKISNYQRTLSIKTVNDKTASQAIARFGLERKLDDWKAPCPVYKKLRQLTRERDQLIRSRTVVKNQLHAEAAEAEPNKNSLKRLKKQLSLFDLQEREIKAELAAIVKSNEALKKKVALLTTIPGVGALTAVTVLGETNSFELIRCRKQLTSYAGLDVVEKQSGTSVRGKTTISKKGNRFLRKALHLPALSAIRHNADYKAVFARLVSRHGVKMKAATAVQRRLLELMYTVYKTNNPFDPEYRKKNREQQKMPLPEQAD